MGSSAGLYVAFQWILTGVGCNKLCIQTDVACLDKRRRSRRRDLGGLNFSCDIGYGLTDF